ncbi:MAG TPA: hypothetical protein VGJ20_02900 [Xanthobacteraceae bacterium]
MKRLPIRGSSVATPWLGEDELKQALSKLGVIAVFRDADIGGLYLELAAVFGTWFTFSPGLLAIADEVIE